MPFDSRHRASQQVEQKHKGLQLDVVQSQR